MPYVGIRAIHDTTQIENLPSEVRGEYLRLSRLIDKRAAENAEMIQRQTENNDVIHLAEVRLCDLYNSHKKV